MILEENMFCCELRNILCNHEKLSWAARLLLLIHLEAIFKGDFLSEAFAESRNITKTNRFALPREAYKFC